MNICASVSSLGKNCPDQLMTINVFGPQPAVCPNLPPLSHLQSSRTVISHPSSMKADNPAFNSLALGYNSNDGYKFLSMLTGKLYFSHSSTPIV